MSLHHRILHAAFCASLSLPTLILAGCSDAGTVNANPNAAAMANGNWQVSGATTAAAKLPAISGEFTTTAGKVTGIVHSMAANACVAPSASFELAGAADDKNVVTLTGPVAGGTLTLTGTIASDGKSLTDASYTVKGGTCAFAQAAVATAQAFSPITGNYAGTFADADGQVANVTANFSQSSTPDANGNFTLAGTASITGDPCFPSSVAISATQVTGGTFTYSITANGSTVTANGTFSSDASTLTVTGWTSSGTCGADTGKQSTMTRQSS